MKTTFLGGQCGGGKRIALLGKIAACFALTRGLYTLMF